MAITKVNNDLLTLDAAQPTITSVGTLTGLTVGYAQNTDGFKIVDAAGLDRWSFRHVKTGTDKLSFRSLVTDNDVLTIDQTGRVTMPSQPAFQVNPSSAQTNIPINAHTTIAFGTEVFDVGANFASNTFTAPVTGKYQLNASIRVDNIDSDASYYQIRIATSNRDYITTFDLRNLSDDPAYWTKSISALADMDASDTVHVSIIQANGTAQSDIATESKFSGILVA